MAEFADNTDCREGVSTEVAGLQKGNSRSVFFSTPVAFCDLRPAPTRVFLPAHPKFIHSTDRVVTDLVSYILIAIVKETSSRFWAVLLEMCSRRHVRNPDNLKKI